MKTKEQILHWVDIQPWKDRFYYLISRIGNITTLEYNDNFIRSAFNWDDATTEEIELDHEYHSPLEWEDKNNQFITWYNKNSVDRVKSWTELCDKYPENNCVDNKALSAYLQLLCLRNDWVKDEKRVMSYKIICKNNSYTIINGFDDLKFTTATYNGLSFPSVTMARDFIKTFEELLDEAKSIL